MSNKRGKSDDDTLVKKLTVKATVASIYTSLGQRDKGLTIYKENHKEARKKLGSSHPTTRWTNNVWPRWKIIGHV